MPTAPHVPEIVARAPHLGMTPFGKHCLSKCPPAPALLLCVKNTPGPPSWLTGLPSCCSWPLRLSLWHPLTGCRHHRD